uniref:Uncharacterized protein n=1 Tax=Anguilla anguilla TaxID=7936 RepID=A0A0E9RYM0_ANGAN
MQIGLPSVSSCINALGLSPADEWQSLHCLHSVSWSSMSTSRYYIQ